MSKIKKIVTTILLCIALLQTYTVFAEDNTNNTTENDFVIEDGVLIKYNGTDKNVVIPNTVKVIGISAFSIVHSMESVTIPNSVKEIQDDAFSNCINLKEVKIPNSVEKIGEGVFYYCKNMTKVTMGNSVKEFGKSNFVDCVKLKTVKLSNELTSIPDWTFQNCRSLQEVTIPQKVKEIGEYAFNGCRDLKKVIFPSTVKEIINNAVFSTGKEYNNEDLVFYAPKGSYVESYAKKAKIPCKALDINKTKLTLKPKQTDTLYMGMPSNLDSWKSSNSSVVSVDRITGKVTAKKKGTATITGTLYGKAYTCKVTVS